MTTMPMNSTPEKASSPDLFDESRGPSTGFFSDLFGLTLVETEVPFQASFRVSEVLEICKIKPYVLRFWESEFEEIGPAISDSGQKLYSYWDLHVLLAVKYFLFEKKFPIQKAKVEFRKVYQKAMKKASEQTLEETTEETTEKILETSTRPDKDEHYRDKGQVLKNSDSVVEQSLDSGTDPVVVLDVEFETHDTESEANTTELITHDADLELTSLAPQPFVSETDISEIDEDKTFSSQIETPKDLESFEQESQLLRSELLESESTNECADEQNRAHMREQITRARDLLLAAQKEIYKVKRTQGWV